jgi:hypothetical protein
VEWENKGGGTTVVSVILDLVWPQTRCNYERRATSIYVRQIKKPSTFTGTGTGTGKGTALTNKEEECYGARKPPLQESYDCRDTFTFTLGEVISSMQYPSKVISIVLLKVRNRGESHSVHCLWPYCDGSMARKSRE